MTSRHLQPYMRPETNSERRGTSRSFGLGNNWAEHRLSSHPQRYPTATITADTTYSRWLFAEFIPEVQKYRSTSYQMVSTSPDLWITSARVTRGTSRTSAVATMKRSHKSPMASRLIVVKARTAALVS